MPLVPQCDLTVWPFLGLGSPGLTVTPSPSPSAGLWGAGVDPGLLVPRAYSPNPGLGHVRVGVLLRSHHRPGLLVCNWCPRQQNLMDHHGESSPACLGAGGSDGYSPGRWAFPVLGEEPSKAERPTAAQGSGGRRLTVPAWLSRGSAFSSAISPLLETSSLTSLPVPPAPARGRSASPTTQRDGFHLREGPGSRGGAGESCCPVGGVLTAPLPSPPLTRDHQRGTGRGRGMARDRSPHEFCLRPVKGGADTWVTCPDLPWTGVGPLARPPA